MKNKLPEDNIYLPHTVIPRHYTVSLHFDFESLTFLGNVVIRIDVKMPTKVIKLNVKNLRVETATLKLTEEKILRSTHMWEDQGTERMAFYFAETIPEGEAVFSVWFGGKMEKPSIGIYQSDYYDMSSQKKTLVATQFEDTYARMAFPCFDQPDMKATFVFIVNVPQGLQAISNMPVVSSFTNHKRTTYMFDKTPLMSTYLAVLVIGELECVETKTINDTLVRVVATPGKSKKGQFGLDVSRHALEFFEDFIGVPFPLPKLDFVALPALGFGAMENWGAITFREHLLLTDKNTSKQVLKQIVDVVPHEIAHMWAGNLVTPINWNDLWLNESIVMGIVSYSATYVSQKMNLGFDYLKDFYTDVITPALDNDALRTTHPVRVAIKSLEEIGTNFDTITYQKGGSIIKMMISHLGLDVFQRCLKEYFTKYTYGNTGTKDFFRSFGETSNLSFGEIFTPWISTPGYPVVTMKKYCDCVDEYCEFSNRIELTQERFLVSGEDLTEDEKKQVWEIPLSVLYEDGRVEKIILKEKKQKFSLFGLADRIVKINAGQDSFCRINYSPEYREKIISNLKEDKINNPVDRAGILSDATALAKAGKIPVAQLLEILTALRDEKEYMVWVEIIKTLSTISAILDGQEKTRLDCFAIELLTPIVDELGWGEKSDENYYRSVLRPIVLGAYGKYGEFYTIAHMNAQVQLYLQSKGYINPDLRSAFFNVAATYADKCHSGLYYKYVNAHNNSQDPEECILFIKALASFKTPAEIQNALEFLLSDNVKATNLIYFFFALAGNRDMSKTAWEFFKNNIERFRKKIGIDMYVAKALLYTTAGLNTEEDARDVENFFKNNPLPGAELIIAQAVEKIRAQESWINRSRGDVKNWLTRWYANWRKSHKA